MRPFEFILMLVAALVLVLSIGVIYRRDELTKSSIRGLLAEASRARQFEVVSLSRRLEAHGKSAAFAIRVSVAFDVDCEDRPVVNRTGTDVRVSICVSGATNHVSIGSLREKPTAADCNRVLLGDAHLDAILSICVDNDIARSRLMERREKLSQVLFELTDPHMGGETWLQVRECTVESRVRQPATDWTVQQLLGLVDATVAIADLVSEVAA